MPVARTRTHADRLRKHAQSVCVVPCFMKTEWGGWTGEEAKHVPCRRRTNVVRDPLAVSEWVSGWGLHGRLGFDEFEKSAMFFRPGFWGLILLLLSPWLEETCSLCMLFFFETFIRPQIPTDGIADWRKSGPGEWREEGEAVRRSPPRGKSSPSDCSTSTYFLS